MLDHVPNELLQIIFELIGPPVWSGDPNPDRQQNLSALSLVSHRFRSIAQPLLFSILNLGRQIPKRLSDDYASNPRCRELVSNVRCILYEGGGPRINPAEMERQRDVLRTIAIDAEKLEELYFRGSNSYPLTLFSGSRIKKLQLLSTRAQEMGNLFLPHLIELSVHDLEVPARGIERRQLPSLRHLALPRCDALDDGIVATIRNFDKQLESVNFPISNLPRFVQELPDFPLERVLIDTTDRLRDTTLFALRLADIVHLRIEHDFFSSATARDTFLHFQRQMDLQKLFNIIARAPASTPLRTVYIRADLKPTTTQGAEEAYRTRIELSGICQERKIELVEEKQPEIDSYCSRISPDFKRRMGSGQMNCEVEPGER